MKEAEAGVHHTEPFIMSREIFREFANSFSEPFPDGWVVDIIVVNPIFVACIIRRINVDAFDFTRVIG
jgi:hypothetical protein